MQVFSIRRDGVIVNAHFDSEGIQPWSDKPCFVYRVNVSVRGAGEYSEYAYGSQADYENGEKDKEEDMARMVVSDLLSAYHDPDEFWQLATGEPDLYPLDKTRKIIELIDYAAEAGAKLEQLEDFAREED